MPTPTLTETIPDSRTARIGKSAKFSYPKDPANQAWYSLVFNEPLGSVVETEITGPDTALSVTTTSVMQDRVALFLAGGAANSTYRIRIGVRTVGDDLLYDTVSLDVARAGSVALDSIKFPVPPAGGGAPVAQGTVMAATADIGLHRVLMFALGGGVVQADAMSPGYVFAGISAQAAVTGTPLLVIETGAVNEPLWSWTPGGALYTGRDGLMTQTPPTTGISQQIAVAISPTSITVQPFAAITRI